MTDVAAPQPPVEEDGLLRFSVSYVTQAKWRFYSLTMPSDVLAATCFATSRKEDPDGGFQRVLDKKRAQEIADYIDDKIGPIPNSIVLSAQPEAELRVIGRGKTLQFANTPRAFLILDGQHRVYGFKLAKTPLRVPVIVFNGLSKQEESRLFIDINTKQRPVPNELLLDIKKLADYETEDEQNLAALFDLFNSSPASPLVGLMSPAERSTKRISRVTFNAAMRPLLRIFGDPDDDERIYNICSGYLRAVIDNLDRFNAGDAITMPISFRALMQLFRDVATRVQDRGSSYTAAGFDEILRPMFSKRIADRLRKPGAAYQELYKVLKKALDKTLTL